ncbi:TIGR00730 family Rossman fold protein [bacterium]|nr:TIGR00730 family Rossman fold protein [bacterium]
MSLRVCVFCSSGRKVDTMYYREADAVGRLIGERGWRLVYGGTTTGPMMTLAAAAKEAGGSVTGIVPQCLVKQGLVNDDLDTLKFVLDMNTRKQAMLNLSDAFIALPGSIGTLEEMTAMIAMRTLGITDKPVILVNTNGHWDHLIALFEKMKEQGFTHDSFAEAYDVVEDADAAIHWLEAWDTRKNKATVVEQENLVSNGESA